MAAILSRGDELMYYKSIHLQPSEAVICDEITTQLYNWAWQ